MKFLFLAAIFISCASASAETGINTVVRLLEVRYSVRQHGMTKAKDQRISMLIVTSEHEDGVTVIQLNLSGRALREWVDEPESAKHNSAWLR